MSDAVRPSGDAARAQIDAWRSSVVSDPTWSEFVEESNARAFAEYMRARTTVADEARAVVHGP